MAFQARVLQTAGTAGTTDVVAGGFGETAGAMTMVTMATANGSAVDEAAISVGFWDGTNMRSSNCAAEHGEGTSDTQRSQNDGQFVTLKDGNGTDKAIGTVANTDNGIRHTWSVDPVAAYLMTTILFGGTAKCATGHLLPTTSGTAVSVSGLTFRPNFVIFCGVSHSGVSDVANSADAVLSMGFASEFDGAIHQRSFGSKSDNGEGTTSLSGEYSNTLIAGGSGNNTGAEVTAFNDDGFDLTRRDASGAYSVQYLAVWTDGDPVWVGDFTDGGAGTLNVSTGHKPRFGMVISTQFNDATYNTYANNSRGGSFGIGATDFDTGDEYSVAYADRHNVGDSDTQSYTDTKVIHKPHHDGQDLMTATVAGRGSDGFSLTYAAGHSRPALALTVGETEKQLRSTGRGWGGSLRNRRMSRLG